MIWQKYDLIFRLQSPMHIGWRKSGNLMQTRGYVTGKVFWAALTARLTRDYDNGAANAARYGEIGEQIQNNFRFSYLYPATYDEKNSKYKIHYPWEDDFDYLFLNSYASTSINYSNQSAEDSMLHETEFISPYTRDGKPVYLCGSIYARRSLPTPLEKWQDTLNGIRFGGERTYGWGKVNCMNCEEDKKDEEDNREEPKICLTKGCEIKAHLQAENITGIVGCIEPLTGWERNNKPYDNINGKTEWALSEALICYEPGSIVSKKKLVCTIGSYGILSEK